MKNRINSINQYLLERFPIAWNTRILWMLSAALVVHLFFFLFGVVTLIDPVSLQGYNVLQSYFKNGMLFLGIVITLLLLVVWIVTLFRNNAFKNFYPTSPWDLFKQFCAYVVIIFACTSFYYSYTLGLQAYIISVYPQERVEKEIRVANDSDMFRSESIYNYTLDERILPITLDTLYCEITESRIDTLQPYLTFKGEQYQYYTFNKITVPKNNNDLVRVIDTRMYVPKNEKKPQNGYTKYQIDSLDSMSLRKEVGDSTITFYFKDKVVDMTGILKTAEPSYYNYTSIFYEKDKNQYDYEDYNTYNDDYSIEEQSRSNPIDSSTIVQVKSYHKILDSNNAKQIKTLLKDQLDLLDYYGVRHNLTVDTWFEMVYHPSDFPVKHLILNSKKSLYENNFLDEDATAFETYASNLESKRYMEKQDLHEVFENLDKVHDTNIFKGSVHFFIWMSFILATIIFIFRTTGLRELLFSIVASGVTFIIIGLICVLITYGSGSFGGEDYVFAYVPLIIGFAVFTITFLAYKSMRKLVSAIFLNITFVYLLPWLFLIIGIISMHQQAACNRRYDYNYDYELCTTLLEQLGIWWSYIFIVAGFIWIFVYSHLIIKWRSLPEK